MAFALAALVYSLQFVLNYWQWQNWKFFKRYFTPNSHNGLLKFPGLPLIFFWSLEWVLLRSLHSYWEFSSPDWYMDNFIWANVTILKLLKVASMLCVYLSPVAAGSGIPQIKCFLNGVKIPKVIRLKEIIAKISLSTDNSLIIDFYCRYTDRIPSLIFTLTWSTIKIILNFLIFEGWGITASF